MVRSILGLLTVVAVLVAPTVASAAGSKANVGSVACVASTSLPAAQQDSTAGRQVIIRDSVGEYVCFATREETAEPQAEPEPEAEVPVAEAIAKDAADAGVAPPAPPVVVAPDGGGPGGRIRPPPPVGRRRPPSPFQ